MAPLKDQQTGKGLGRKGTRASMACMSCRQRKVKCDVQDKQPGVSCTQCHHSQLNCALEPGGDRRKVRSGNEGQENLSALRGRMQALEDMLLKDGALGGEFAKRHQRAHPSEPQSVRSLSPKDSIIVNSAASATSRSPQSSPNRIVMRNGDESNEPPLQSSDKRNPVTSSMTAVSGINEDDMFVFGAYNNPPSQVTTFHVEHDVGDMPTDFSQLAFDPSAGRHQTAQMAVSHESHQDEPLEVLQTMTPARTDMESLTESGDLRFFGPTSQPYLHSVHEESPLSNLDELEECMSLSADSAQVRQVLFQSYWSTHALAAKVVVDQVRFLKDQAMGKRTAYYSNFLENALLACATRTSTSSAIRALGRQYIERAKSEVLKELEHLNIASMQGFLLLSDFEATMGRDRLGWMFCGIACRSLFDLGLHDHSSASRHHEVVDASSRYSIFLTTFVYDQLWSLYLGRPSSLSLNYLRSALSAAKDITISDELSAWVSLCTQIAKITEILNSSNHIDAKAYDRRLSEVSDELEACFQRLPVRLKYEDGSTIELDATAFGLNIQLCGIRIVLHRLWARLRDAKLIEAAKDPAGQQLEDQSSTRFDQTRSANIVHQNAIRIAKLMRTYKQIYGVERIITIMLDNMYVAATALVAEHLGSLNSLPTLVPLEQKDIQWLQSLSDTLDDAKKYYPITTVMMTTLSQLVGGTDLSNIFPANRVSHSIPQSTSPVAVPQPADGTWGYSGGLIQDFTFDTEPVLGNSFPMCDERFLGVPDITPWGLGFVS